MSMYASLHLKPDKPCRITCRHQSNEEEPEGYPVFDIGTVTIFLAREHLERIVAEGSAYLSAHPETVVPDSRFCPECRSETYETISGMWRCDRCRTAWLGSRLVPAESDGSTDKADIMPLPAEAATDGGEWTLDGERLDGPAGYYVSPSKDEPGHFRIGNFNSPLPAHDGYFTSVEDAVVAAMEMIRGRSMLALRPRTGAVVDADELLIGMASEWGTL